MVVEAERNVRRSDELATRVTRCWIYLNIMSWLPAAIAGVFGVLCLVRVVSGWTAEAMAIAIIGLGGLSGIAAVANRNINRAHSSRLDILGRALDAAPEARLIVAPDGRIVYANKAFAQLFPGGAEPPLDRVQRVLFPDGDAQEQFRRLRRCAAEGRSAAETLSLSIGRNDQISRFKISVDSLAAEQQYSSWVFQDLVVNKETEMAIEDELNNFSELLDSTSIGFYSADGDGRFRLANRTFGQWLGRTALEITAGEARVHDFLATPPPAGSRPFQPFAAPGVGARCGEILLKARHGHIVPARIAQNITVSGSELRTRSVVFDLSPERGWEAALNSSERFRRCFADAPVGIALIDRFGRFEEANRAVGDLLGTTPERLKGEELIGLLDEEDRGRVTVKLGTLAKGRSDPEPVEVRPRRPSNKTIILCLSRPDDGSEATSLSVPRSAARPPYELTAHFIDVTDQKKLEIQFAQSQKMRAVGQLAGGVAHDFNNLLTAMIGFCDLLLLRSPPGDPSFADIMQIKQNANRAANLVRQLLAFSRQQTLQPRVLNITDVLYELRHLIERLIGENIKLDVVHGRELWLAKVDQGQLEQVIIKPLF